VRIVPSTHHVFMEIRQQSTAPPWIQLTAGDSGLSQKISLVDIAISCLMIITYVLEQKPVRLRVVHIKRCLFSVESKITPIALEPEASESLYHVIGHQDIDGQLPYFSVLLLVVLVSIDSILDTGRQDLAKYSVLVALEPGLWLISS